MNKKPILIVDDDKDILSAIKMILELHGYAIESASNGKEALELLHSELPSLILLDLMMPVMDGFEFLQNIESNPKFSNIPVIVMTATHNKVKKITKYTTLLKPFNVEVMLDLIGDAHQRT